jgi:predicted ArsR family transcriptional regulator
MDRLDIIGGHELREMLLYVRGSAGPVTAADASAAIGVHRSVARSRLEQLVHAGLVETRFERRSGRSGPGAGRPAKFYAAAPEAEALEFPPRHFPTLVARLLDEVPVERRRQALRSAGEDFGRWLADAAGLEPAASLDEGLARVCGAIRSLGFHAVLNRIEGHTALIATPTCPLRPLVGENSDASHIDRGMWAGLVERSVLGVRAESVACETNSCLEGTEACMVVIRLGS